jgi:ParB family transcriptional regulator, chromosome partitioning protein
MPMGAPRGPISQVSGDAAVTAALEELAGEMRQARDSGRLIQKIPLDEIDLEYLVRDRVVADDQEMQTLMQSIAARGQQHPVEVVQLAPGRFGLISGWRRVTALRRLREETGDAGQFGAVHAMLRRPETAADAYLSMVEENEIRVGLSYYERARIAAKAVEQGVYESEKAALLALFGAASRAKRSKIRSFLPIYHQLDTRLRFAGAIPERLGLRLSKALEEEPGFAGHLQKVLATTPCDTPEAEAALLEATLADLDRPAAPAAKPAAKAKAPQASTPAATTSAPAASAIQAHMAGNGDIILRGPGVNSVLLSRLRLWLAEQG